MSDYKLLCRHQTGRNVALDYTSVSVQTSSVSAQTYAVRLSATSPIHYRIVTGSDVSSTCTSADPLLPINFVEIVGIQPGSKISAIKSAMTTSADGRLTITELA